MNYERFINEQVMGRKVGNISDVQSVAQDIILQEADNRAPFTFLLMADGIVTFARPMPSGEALTYAGLQAGAMLVRITPNSSFALISSFQAVAVKSEEVEEFQKAKLDTDKWRERAQEGIFCYWECPDGGFNASVFNQVVKSKDQVQLIAFKQPHPHFEENMVRRFVDPIHEVFRTFG